MLVVFDARAQSVPQWLAASGFVLWEGVKIAGAQYRIPYVYKVCEVSAFCLVGGMFYLFFLRRASVAAPWTCALIDARVLVYIVSRAVLYCSERISRVLTTRSSFPCLQPN